MQGISRLGENLLASQGLHSMVGVSQAVGRLVFQFPFILTFIGIMCERVCSTGKPLTRSCWRK